MRRSLVICVVAVAGLIATRVGGLFITPESTPVDRIIKNAQAHIDRQPEDPQGYYVLGRAHYLAWTLKSDAIPELKMWHPAQKKGGLPMLPGDWMALSTPHDWWQREVEAERRVRARWGLAEDQEPPEPRAQQFSREVHELAGQLAQEGWTAPRPAPEVLDAHAKQAVIQQHKAVELEPENALYHIGLASIREQYASRAGETGLAPDGGDTIEPAGEAVRKRWLQAALAGYARAYELAIAKDRKRTTLPIAGLRELVSYNAVEGYIRVAEALGGEGSDARLLARMRLDKARFESLRPGAITPIIFSLQPGRTLEDLLAPQTVVEFDLDGDGRVERRPWVRPDTAILVWDPQRTGRITSGRQLFGTVTWWLIPGDGYRALDLLDDNRDGELSGHELAGMALWFDRNGDGVSDPGEVIPIEDTDIAGLRVRPLSQDGDALMHPHGVRLHGTGVRLPTWDWVVEGGRSRARGWGAGGPSRAVSSNRFTLHELM